MDGPNNGIVFYHYSFSPYARRVAWYLALRGIDYAQVMQPPVMPRPDLESIGVKYRRIPIMTIGKDVYCDTRLILSKLEKLFPKDTLGASEPDQKAIQKLLEVWSVESGLFARASQLIPSDLPLMRDQKFLKDREQLTGMPWSKERINAQKPEALVHINKAFRFLETTLLADDRDWILKTTKPSLADIEAIWAFDWLNGMKTALPKDLISPQQYPKVFAWIARFNEAVKTARNNAPKPATLKGADAAKRILTARFVETEGNVDNSDPTGIRKDALVEVWPTDSGFSHKDRGNLVALNDEEIVIAATNGLRIHFPRTGFRVKLLPKDTSAKL